MIYETRPDRAAQSTAPLLILVAIPTRGRNWWDDCRHCALEGEPRKCVDLNASLRSLRGVGCKPKQRWVRA